MNRKANVYCRGILAGRLEETAEGYRFTYDTAYLTTPGTRPLSMTLPKRQEPYVSKTLFSFFFGLLAEGILQQTQCRNLKLDENDHFGQLIKTAHGDTIGVVTVEEQPVA